jgi:hypothetical protein
MQYISPLLGGLGGWRKGDNEQIQIKFLNNEINQVFFILFGFNPAYI